MEVKVEERKKVEERTGPLQQVVTPLSVSVSHWVLCVTDLCFYGLVYIVDTSSCIADTFAG